MPDTPEAASDPPSSTDDPLFAPTPDVLGGLNPDDLFAIATSPVRGEWEPPSPEELTKVLTGYFVTRFIGRGGMGAVYEARHTALDRLVALKFLPADRHASDPAFVERARREAQMLSRMHHPNIVTVYDSSATAAGDLFFTMELVHGETLAQRLRRSRLSTGESVALLRQVCDAMEYAHSEGIIHRDLKPSNILITGDGRVKVVDFGLAVPETREPDERLTLSGVAVGTYDYSAPEQMGAGTADARSDIYSLGVIAYQLLTGEVPRGAFDPPSQRRRAVDQGFDSVVLRALQSDPERRFATAGEFREALVAAHETALLALPEGPVDPTQEQVLQDFYQRTVADVPPTVRHYIEDKLLTPSGYRDSRPLEDALQQHGIPRVELQRLVERRLLRIEERAGISRVEISHDRLTGAIQASRDARRAVQAERDARERERQMRWKMRLRVSFASLAGLAAAGVIWGWSERREAQRHAAAEREAQHLLLALTRVTGPRLANQLEPIGRLQTLEPVIAEMDAMFTRYRPSEESASWDHLHAEFLTQKAGVQAAQGRYTAACETLRQALSIRNGLEPVSAVLQRALLMQHLCARGQGNEAIQEWPALLEQTQALPDTAAAGHATALAADAHARALQSLRNWNEAIQKQQEGIARLETAIAALPANGETRAGWEHDLAQMYLRLSQAHKDERQIEPAIIAARKANVIAGRLAASKRPDPRWLATHARSWMTLGDNLPRGGQERKDTYRSALTLTERLVTRDPENILWLREHANAMTKVGVHTEPAATAIPYLTQAVDATRRVAEADNSVEQWQWDLASSLLQRSYADKDLNQPAKSEVWVRQAIDVMENFVQSSDVPVPDRIFGLSAAMVNLGDVLRDQQRNSEVLQHYTSWIERSRRDSAVSPSWHFLAAVAGWDKGAVQVATGDIAGALRTFSGASADLDRAYRQLPRQDWPSPPWGWRRREANILSAAINAAGPNEKQEAKRIGAAAVDLMLQFRHDVIPEGDVEACAKLKQLTQ